MANAHVIRCAVGPTNAPEQVGQHWIDTTNGLHYLASGTSSVSDWTLITVGTYFQATQQSDQTGITTAVAVDMAQTRNSASLLYVWDPITDSLEITATGFYRFTMTLTADSATGARETSLTKLQRDSGSGFADIPASEAHTQMYGYHRNLVSGKQTQSLSSILSITDGDKIRMSIESTTGTINTVAVGTGLLVESL